MPAFWAEAARVLKPGGTVALWTSGQVRANPSSPGSAAVQAAIEGLEASLGEHTLLGNRLRPRDLYVNLPLPWTLETPVGEFDEGSFLRKEWGTGPGSEPSDRFHTHQGPMDMAGLEKMLSSASSVTRWRQAHPDAVGTESDIVRVTRREIERALHEAGVEEGKEFLNGCVSGVLLMVKRKV